MYTTGHPLCRLRSELEKSLSKELASHICFPEDLPVVLEGATTECNLEGTDRQALKRFPDGDSSEKTWCLEPYILNTIDLKRESDCVYDGERDDDSEIPSGVDGGAVKWVPCHLRTTILEQLALLTSHTADHLVIASCDVYSRCCVSPHKLPVSHEMAVVGRSGENIAMDPVKTVCSCLEMATSRSVSITQSRSPQVLRFHSGLELHCTKYVELVSNNTKTKVGHIWENVCDSASFSIVLLNLDLIVQKVIEIESPRLLWSQNNRFLQQFSSWPSKFQAFSVYSLQHVHDMSFWESPDVEFDDLCFSDIIREIAGDVVVRVVLLERYHDENLDQWSRCYRLTYMSDDQAVSYIASWNLQSLIRLETATRLEIQLR